MSTLHFSMIDTKESNLPLLTQLYTHSLNTSTDNMYPDFNAVSTVLSAESKSAENSMLITKLNVSSSGKDSLNSFPVSIILYNNAATNYPSANIGRTQTNKKKEETKGRWPSKKFESLTKRLTVGAVSQRPQPPYSYA